MVQTSSGSDPEKSCLTSTIEFVIVVCLGGWTSVILDSQVLNTLHTFGPKLSLRIHCSITMGTCITCNLGLYYCIATFKGQLIITIILR